MTEEQKSSYLQLYDEFLETTDPVEAARLKEEMIHMEKEAGLHDLV